MKTYLKVLLGITLSFMCVFASLGYAGVSTQLEIFAHAETTPAEPEGIYISHVSIYKTDGVSVTEFGQVLPTNLQSTVQVNKANASVTYEITVHNKTDVTYWYLGTDVMKEIASNSLINSLGGIYIMTDDNATASSSYFNTSDWIPPQTERIFYATYTFGENAQGAVSTLVNFKFGMHMGSVSDGFLKVLNDKNSVYGYYYLANAFNEKYRNEQSTVIANIGDEEEIFNNLFGTELSINVNGVNVPVTVLVERRDVDGKDTTGDSYGISGAPTACEYTLYLTVDNLDSPGGKATVYAVSYTCGADGVWYQIGELYEGESTVEDYDTSDNKYEGAVDVEGWLAVPKEYNVTKDISYKVGYEQGTEYDKLKTIDELMSTNDQEFYNKVNNNSEKLLKPVCNILYSYVHNNGQYIESERLSNKHKSGYDALKAAFDKIKPYCYIGNGAQEVKIQNASSLSRAELIQLLEEIQMTYDYYMAINPNG